MIIGHGIDLVSIGRMKSGMDRWGEKFINKIFCENEKAYCQSKPQSEKHYASRFAAKEAFLKALQTGLTSGISLHDIVVESNDSGVPHLSLSGRALQIAKERGVNKIFLSLSDENDYSMASVILTA